MTPQLYHSVGLIMHILNVKCILLCKHHLECDSFSRRFVCCCAIAPDSLSSISFARFAVAFAVVNCANMSPLTPTAKSLSSKTILITGASSGIGRSTALEFARASPQDLKLIITAKSRPPARAVHPKSSIPVSRRWRQSLYQTT